MERTGYGRILPFQFVWIMYLCQVFPACLIKTFIELLIGSMLSLSGFVCRALLPILVAYAKHWGIEPMFKQLKWLGDEAILAADAAGAGCKWNRSRIG